MSAQLPYRIELDNRRVVVALLPELNEVPWADIEKVGSEIIEKIHGLASPQLLVDLCALNYMGSAQVALVVRMFKLVKEKSGKMVVANRDPMVLEVLSLAGLNKVWTIVESRERALSMLGGGGGGGSLAAGGSSGAGEAAANPLPNAIAIIAAVAAAVFVVLHLANPALIPSRGDVFGILGGAVVAFLTGLWAMSSGSRGLGIGIVVVSVAMLLYGVFEIAKPAASTGSPTPIEATPPASGAAGAAAPKADAAAPAPPATPPGVKPGTVDPANAAAPPPGPGGALPVPAVPPDPAKPAEPKAPAEKASP